MKAILGVDLQYDWKIALDLLHRIGFADLDLALIHAANPAVPFAPLELASQFFAQADYAEAVRQAGTAALDRAVGAAKSLGVCADARLVFGSPVESLIRLAEDEGAELIAVTSTHRGNLSSLFLGSVSRGLAIGSKTSLLAAKGPATGKGPMRAIFATDHSDYAQRSLDRFLAMRPQGIARMDVVTAFGVSDYEAVVLNLKLPRIGEEISSIICRRLTELNEGLAAKIRMAGIESECHVLDGHPDDALPQAMKAAEADLLVMGAQGHGFVERFLIGSVSLKQLVSEPYSVLLVRA